MFAVLRGANVFGELGNCNSGCIPPFSPAKGISWTDTQPRNEQSPPSGRLIQLAAYNNK